MTRARSVPPAPVATAPSKRIAPPGSQALASNLDTLAMYVVRRADQGCAISTIQLDPAAILATHQLADIAPKPALSAPRHMPWRTADGSVGPPDRPPTRPRIEFTQGRTAMISSSLTA